VAGGGAALGGGERRMKLIVRFDGREEEVEVERQGDLYRITVGGRGYAVDAQSIGADGRTLLVDGRQHEVSVRSLNGGSYRICTAQAAEDVEVLDPLTHLARAQAGGAGAEGAKTIDAYMPGRVVTLLVAEGDEVEAGQGVLVLEAMKMENEIEAERRGVIRRLLVEPGQAVEGGDPLFEME